MKAKFALTLATLAAAAGCSEPKQNIVFSDDAEVRAAIVSNTKPVVVQPKLEKADELQIDGLIFGYLLDRHFWDLPNYTAVFLQADESEVRAMMKKYPNHVPPIKDAVHASVHPHRAPVDKDTRKPAMILSVDLNEPNPDGSIDAIGRWFAGDAVTGFRAFHLVKGDEGWKIADVK